MKIKFLLGLIAGFVIVGQLSAASYLFQKFPALQAKIPHITLCDLPTPVTKLHNFGSYLGCGTIFIKRDDLCGKNMGAGLHLYGGNKPRKAEFLLADALSRGAKTVIAYGSAGSNCALAIALYANALGLKPLLMLKNQPNSYVVRHNLLLDITCNAQFKLFPDNKTRSLAAEEILKNDASVYLIPTGGSNPTGALGFVNAAFELASQIEARQIPEPDLIYMATSSCGTTAGLLLGLKAAKIKSKIVAVCVEPEEEKDEFLLTIKSLFIRTNELLNSLDQSFPLIEFPEQDLILNKKFCGTQYGLFIPEAVDAIKLFKNKENITLEGTYSSKPIAAIVDDVTNGNVRNKTILFWDTYCGIDFSYLTNFNDYKKLPQEFYKYFEEDVQPLAK